MEKPAPISGLRHVALNVSNLEECEQFYVGLLGMKVDWRPDKDNVYLCSGNDNLALHRLPAGKRPEGIQRLDHIGFILNEPGLVDEWFEYLSAHEVKMKAAPKTHRDGARSFYCEDPAGNVVQMIYHLHLKHL